MLNFRLLGPSLSNERSADELPHSKTKVYPLEFCSYLIWELRFKYFRFLGYHMELPTSGYVAEHRQRHH